MKEKPNLADVLDLQLALIYRLESRVDAIEKAIAKTADNIDGHPTIGWIQAVATRALEQKMRSAENENPRIAAQIQAILDRNE